MLFVNAETMYVKKKEKGVTWDTPRSNGLITFTLLQFLYERENHQLFIKSLTVKHVFQRVFCSFHPAMDLCVNCEQSDMSACFSIHENV